METVRYDVMPINAHRWLLTDSSNHSSQHVSAVRAVTTAMQEASRLSCRHVVVFFWRQDRAEKIYDSRENAG